MDIKTKIDEAIKRTASSTPTKKIAVLMSGGVDSTLAAMICKRAGLDAVGVTMETGHAQTSARAAAICAEIGIEHLSFDLRDEFASYVVEPFRSAYMRGETPNPCSTCNRYVKLGALVREIDLVIDGASIATGHYASIARTDRGVALSSGSCAKKDQSYFLSLVPKDILSRVVFPLGTFEKDETREAARILAPSRAINIAEAASSPESMDICFLEGGYRALFDGERRRGEIVSLDGSVLGHHDGIEAFTIGQRRGLGIAHSSPLYVVGIDAPRARVIVAERLSAFTRRVRAVEINEIVDGSISSGVRALGKIRSQASPSPCSIETDAQGITAIFDEPQFAPSRGQTLALYDGDILIAGGVIASGLDEICVAK